MVARETSPEAALRQMGLEPAAGEVDRLVQLADILATEGVTTGLLGPNEAGRMWRRHIFEGAALVRHLDGLGRVVDVGSGAGLPGLVLACLGFDVLLVEAQARRALFLERVVRRLGLGSLVLQGRGEDLGRSDLRETRDAAVARALAPPAVSLELCLPFVRPGGRMLLLATPEEVGGVAEILGGSEPRWVELSVPGAEEARWVMIVEKVRPTPERYPRRAGVPQRRPLG